MGSIPDRWLTPQKPSPLAQNRHAKRSRPKDRQIGAAGKSLRSAENTDDEKEASVSACVIEKVHDEWLYLEKEVPVTFSIDPRQIEVLVRNEQRQDLEAQVAVLSRIEIHTKDKSVRPERNGKYKQIVLALWPYGNGWVCPIPLRPAGPKYQGKQFSRKRPEWTPKPQPIEECLKEADALPYDPYLTDKAWLCAGRFLLPRYAPLGRSTRPRNHRGNVAGQKPVWLLGLCADFDAIAKELAADTRLLEAGQTPKLPKGRSKDWTKQERRCLRENANELALIAARFALAGYRNSSERKRFLKRGGKVLDYAMHVARDLAATRLKLDISPAITKET